ncbi:flagellar basal body-associated FliL family protein [Nitriliruptor alkaliphilus]|uniref:flagellar basal body-associated FliL family protein n=1 Tax=Nitriliruptor alkaliphilus TaxID=427918 RepID=UPI000696B843|nr:flagellar basal body-associated FliL family protein [Nitriliruptor alkaliphilus]
MSATTAPAPPELFEDEESASGGKRKLLLILLAVLLVGGAAAWFLVIAPGGEAEAAEVVEGTVLPLDPLTTTTGTAALHHARVALALVLVEGADEEVITARAPLLQDALLREVATMNADVLRSADGSNQLRVNLTSHAQEIWPDGEVMRVVLTELLVQ